MIISRTPLRISLGGGGTDLPHYYETSGHGFLIAAAISQYIYIAVNRNFDSEILLKYSEVERTDSVNSVRHPLLRECLREVGLTNHIEISSMADIPAGTGLGSSGAFAVGVLKALRFAQHQSDSNLDIAKTACQIEMVRLGEPVGKQDQYASALGGLASFTFHSNGAVDYEPLVLDLNVRSQLEENLLLFYTGIRRSASDVLGDERRHTETRTVKRNDNLDRTREIGYQTRDTLLRGDLRAFGALLSQQWSLKYERQPSATHDAVNRWIQEGVQAGASGGKLVGAGGGGFLLFYAEGKSGVKQRMLELGLVEVPFNFDYQGSTILVSR